MSDIRTKKRSELLEQFNAVLDEFARIDNSMPIGRVKLLLYIALYEIYENDAIQLFDLTKGSGVIHATAYRHVQAFSGKGPATKQSPNFLEQAPDPNNARQVMIHMTDEGREFIRKISAMLEPKAEVKPLIKEAIEKVASKPYKSNSLLSDD